MLIVAGHLDVAPEDRAAYLEGCIEVVRSARRTPGCVDFAITADSLDPGRVRVFEQWETWEAVEAFRGDGPSDEQAATILAVEVFEHDIGATRSLT